MRPDPAISSLRSDKVLFRGLFPTRRVFRRLSVIMLLAVAGLFAQTTIASALTIHIRLGQKFQRCNGFGLCDIWVSNEIGGNTADADR